MRWRRTATLVFRNCITLTLSVLNHSSEVRCAALIRFKTRTHFDKFLNLKLKTMYPMCHKFHNETSGGGCKEFDCVFSFYSKMCINVVVSYWYVVSLTRIIGLRKFAKPFGKLLFSERGGGTFDILKTCHVWPITHFYRQLGS